MAEYRLRLTYSLAAEGDVIFPEGKTWDDVSAWSGTLAEATAPEGEMK